MRSLLASSSLLFVSLSLALGCGGGFDSCEESRTCAPEEDEDGLGGGGGDGNRDDGTPVEGGPCNDNHATACVGADQKVTLLCKDGTWQVNVVCSAEQNCDQETGLCTELAEACVDRKPGDEFCDGEKVRAACGPDRVSTEEVEECPGTCEEEDGGATCSEECDSEHGGCDPLVTCVIVEEEPECGACPSGYSGDGETGCAPLLMGLTLSEGTLSPELDDAVTAYSVKVPLITETLGLVPSVPAGAEVTVSGDTVLSDEEWISPVLNLGLNEFELVVSQPGHLSTTYVISVTRGEQEAYLKASNTEASDSFGSSVSLSGDGNTLAVGANQEDSAGVGVNAGGVQTNNGANLAGAVYIFSRTGTGWIQQAYVKASNTGAGDIFGTSVSLSSDGNTLAVGAAGEASDATGVGGYPLSNAASDAGAVYVFSRTGSVWAQQAYVKASNTGAGDRFGGSVSLSGDGNTLAVGATQEDSAATGIGGNQASDAASSSGAVYVFLRTGSVWTQQAYVKASNAETLDVFGSSVSLSSDGNTLAAGAYGEDSAAAGVGGDQSNNAASPSGAVYVFSRTGSVWTQQAYVKASNTAVGDYFGRSVSLSSDGNILAVGAHLEDSAATDLGGDQESNAAENSGAVYVFSRTGSVWSQQAYVKSSNTGVGDGFGNSVSLSSDGVSLVVGASFEDSAAIGVNGDQTSDAAAGSGAVYVFR